MTVSVVALDHQQLIHKPPSPDCAKEESNSSDDTVLIGEEEEEEKEKTPGQCQLAAVSGNNLVIMKALL